MGLDIASVFFNATDEGKTYMSIVIDDVFKEIYPILKDIRFSLIEIPDEKRKENSPIYKISAYKPKEKN